MIRAAVIALALTAVAAPAFAQSDREEFSVAVMRADLRLDREEDANRMLSRIDRAARQACRSNERMDLSMRRAAQQCRRDAVETAVRRLNAPVVRQVYNERTGRDTLVASAAR